MRLANFYIIIIIVIPRKPIAELRSVTCHVVSHNVTCHPTQVNVPHLNPSQTDLSVLHLPTPEEWKAELTLVLVIY